MIRAADNPRRIRDYVEAVFRHKKKIVIYNLLVITAVIGVIFLWPRKYKSEAKLFVKIGRENTRLDPTATTGQTISVQETDREDEIMSVIDVLSSRGVAANVVERVGAKVVLGQEPLPGAEEGPTPNPIVATVKETVGGVIHKLKHIDPISAEEEAVQEILENLNVDAERKSTLVSVSYDTDSPALAQAVVSELVDVFKETHARINQTSGTRDFFVDQHEQLKKKVADTSDALREAKDRIGLASIQGQRDLLESEMLSVQSSKLDTVRRSAEATAKLDKLKTLLAKHPERVKTEDRTVPNTGRDDLESQLYTLQVRRLELQAKYDESHPLLIAIREQEEDARKELGNASTEKRNETTETLSPIHESLQLDYAKVEAETSGYQAMLSTLDQQQKQVLSQMQALNRAEIEIRSLERELQLAESNYMKYSDNLEDARVDEALNENAISNINVQQTATLEEDPVSPSKLIVGLLGIAAMAFGSVAIVTGLEAVDDSVRRPRDLDAVLEAPVIVSVPSESRYSHVLR